MLDLGSPGGPGSRSQAHGINDNGEIVGLVNPAEDGLDRAFYWTSGGGMVELPTLTGVESGARAINNAGVVAGYGDIASGVAHPVRWTSTAPPDDSGPKVQLCHYTGNGSYHLIDVSLDAEAAHRAHGDGKIGEAVPGSPGKVFTASCTVQ
jgi:probable HAF family extracellular repeat protein